MYLRHYPDGFCRVCLTPIKDETNQDSLYCIGMGVWMFALAYANTVPFDGRLLYLILISGLIVYYLLARKLPIFFAILVMIMSASCLLLPIDTLFWWIACIGGLLTMTMLCMYIPTSFLMLGVAILMSSLYSLAIVLLTLSRSTPLFTAVIVCILSSIWYLAIRARPPLGIV